MDGTHVADLVTANAARVPDQPAVIDVTSANTLTWAQLDEAVSAEADRVSARGRQHRATGWSCGWATARRSASPCSAPSARARSWCRTARSRSRRSSTSCSPTAARRSWSRPRATTPPGRCAATVGATVHRRPGPRRPARRVGPGWAAGEDIALLVYASGTTGVPRGIRLSHRALLANRAQTAALRPAPVTPVDRVLLSLPLFHIFGLAAGFLQVCWVGATVVLTEQLDGRADRRRPRRAAGERARGRADDVPRAAGPARRATCAPPPRACGCAPRAARPLPPEWLAAFQQATGLAIVEGYGLTEAGPIVTTNPLGAPPKPGSVGRALPGVELRLVDAEGRPRSSPTTRTRTSTTATPASSPSAGPTSSPATGPTARAAPTPTAGSAPPTSGSSTPTATCTWSTGPPTSSSSTGSTSTPARWSRCSSRSRASRRPRWSGSATSGRARSSRRCWSPTRRRASTRTAVRAFCAQRLARFKVPAVITFVEALPRTPTGKIARRQLARS